MGHGQTDKFHWRIGRVLAAPAVLHPSKSAASTQLRPGSSRFFEERPPGQNGRRSRHANHAGHDARQVCGCTANWPGDHAVLGYLTDDGDMYGCLFTERDWSIRRTVEAVTGSTSGKFSRGGCSEKSVMT